MMWCAICAKEVQRRRLVFNDVQNKECSYQMWTRASVLLLNSPFIRFAVSHCRHCSGRTISLGGGGFRSTFSARWWTTGASVFAVFAGPIARQSPRPQIMKMNRSFVFVVVVVFVFKSVWYRRYCIICCSFPFQFFFLGSLNNGKEQLLPNSFLLY